MSPDRTRYSSIGVDRVVEWNGCEAEANTLPGARSRVILCAAGTASDAVTYPLIANRLPRRERATLAVQRDAGVTRKGGWRWRPRHRGARLHERKKGYGKLRNPFSDLVRLQDQQSSSNLLIKKEN
jgi:hypothetical protein